MSGDLLRARSGPRAARVSPRGAASEIALSLMGAAGAFALGGLTAVGQAIAGGLDGFANSPSGWTLVTVGLIVATARRERTAALLGVASFALLNLGYSVVSTMIGHPDGFSGFWVVVGFIVGVPVGVAALWLGRRYVWRTALACGGFAGVALGDVVVGTGSLYSVVLVVGAVSLLAATAVRLRMIRSVIVEIATTAAVVLLYVLAFTTLSG